VKSQEHDPNRPVASGSPAARGAAHRAARERGSALMGILVLAMVIGGLLYATSMTSTTELADSRRGLDRVKVLYIAEAGVERAINQLRAASRKTAFVDPLMGVRALFADGAGGYRAWAPYDAEDVLDGTARIGEFDVTMTAADRAGGVDVTITSTGFMPAAPASLPRGVPAPRSLTVRSTVHLTTLPSKVFDSGYFLNNWGWFYGSSIFCRGNARSNGQFDSAGYAPTLTGQATYDGLSFSGSDARLEGYRDDNADGAHDGKDGGIFSGWDIVGVQNVVGEGAKAKNQHEFQEQVEMPNLSDLTLHEQKAASSGGQIHIGSTLVSDEVYGDEGGEKQNLYLVGTASAPVKITGTVVVRGSVIIKGVITGQGSIVSGGNIHIPDNLVYKNAPAAARPASPSQADTEAWLTTNKDKDFVGLFARENIVLGDHTNSTWRSYVGSWLGSAMNESKEDAGEDGIPHTRAGRDGVLGTADDDVLEGDGVFTTERYTSADQALGLIPAGKAVGDRIPGTGEDIDGDGQYDPRLTVSDLDFKVPLTTSYWGGNMPALGILSYSLVASLAMTRVDGVFFTNHAFAWLSVPTSPIHVNGALVSRNESIVYGGPGLNFNYDCRLLGGAQGLGADWLPRTMAPIATLSWAVMDARQAH
jgi:hypothetical protein